MSNEKMCNDNIKVLVVEDEPSIRKFITINLIRNGFSVMEAESGESGLEILNSFIPRVIVLDIMLPGMDGFEFCRRVRQEMPDTAIIMLTARTQDSDKIMGLELGADDYMVKPFNPLELIARIRTVLRRMDGVVDNNKRIRSGKFLLDINAQRFFKHTSEISLTPTEFSILKMFMTNSGRALSRNELLNSVWGKNYFGDLKALDVYIRRLREKLEDNPSEPKFIETVWGYGYRWQQDN